MRRSFFNKVVTFITLLLLFTLLYSYKNSCGRIQNEKRVRNPLEELISQFGRIQSVEEVKETLESCLSQINVDPSKKEKYMILINGDFLSRHADLHKNNISQAYEAGCKLNFKERNIFILSFNNNPRPIETDKDPLLVNGKGTKENFKQVINYLSENVDDNDLVVIYGTGHGDRIDGKIMMCLEGPDLSVQEYRSMIEKINAQTIVSIMDQCYSGGFCDELSDSKVKGIAIASTDRDHWTYCKYFSEGFWNAFGNKKMCDSNRDGDVSVKEAFDIALREYKEKSKKCLTERQTNAQYVCLNGVKDISLK